MTTLLKQKNLKHCAWILFLGILTACRGGGFPTSTIVPSPVVSVPFSTEIPPISAVTSTFAVIPTNTLTPAPTSTLALTETPNPTVTPAQPEIITLENASKIAQIGQPFSLESFLAEFVFRPEATWLVESEDWEQIKVYDLNTGNRVATLVDKGVGIERLIVSSDGRFLAAVSPSQQKVVLWNLDAIEKIGEFPLLGYESFPGLFPSPTGGEFSSDNQFLVVWGCRIPALNYQGLRVGCISSGVIVYDLSKNEIYQELNGYQEATTRVTFSADNSTLVLTGKGESILKADVYVWDVFNKVKIHTYSSEYDYMTGGRFELDNKLFVAESGGYLLSFDPKSWQVLSNNRPISNGQLGYFVYSHVAKILIVDDLSGISIRDLDNTTVYHRFNLQIGFIYSITISPDGRLIYTISEDGFVRTWGIPSPP